MAFLVALRTNRVGMLAIVAIVRCTAAASATTVSLNGPELFLQGVVDVGSWLLVGFAFGLLLR